MNCERFQTVVSELARNEIMEATDRTSALRHIDECESCGQTWTNQNDLSEGLRGLAGRMNTLQAPAHLEEQLRAAFRDRSRLGSIARLPQRWPYWVGAAAAVLLVVFGLLIWRSLVASQRQPVTEANVKSATIPQPNLPKPEKARASELAESKTPNQVAPKRAAPRPRHFQATNVASNAGTKQSVVQPTVGVTANAETKEVATAFVPLDYGNTADLQDGGHLVRVELPRSALARFGLPMNMNRADERVKADVLVGADGLARAIRFVK
jgi:hypothetical protein